MNDATAAVLIVVATYLFYGIVIYFITKEDK